MQGTPDRESDSETMLSQDFAERMKFKDDFHTEEIEKGTIDNEDEEEEEFSFTCGGAHMSPIAAEDAFINGQIKPFFPLFNRDLFFSGEESDSLRGILPAKPPVKKVFVETKDSGESTSADATGGASFERKAVEVSPEVCKKSNSTGFSKIWRFKDFLGRSNSDGRDAFVFLNDSSQAPPSAAVAPLTAGRGKGEVKIERKVSAIKAKKGKTASLSAHEVYLKSKAKDGEKRRSYLPYRPELMGFFTNVSSGLSKNVHPY